MKILLMWTKDGFYPVEYKKSYKDYAKIHEMNPHVIKITDYTGEKILWSLIDNMI